MGTRRARKAAPGVRSAGLDCKTVAPTSDRTSNRSIRTNRGAAGPVARLDRVIDPTRLDRTREPHHQQKRRPVHLHLLLPGHGAMPPPPGHGKTARPLPFKEEHSFHRNAHRTAIPSNRSSVVPAERLRWAQAARPIDPSSAAVKRHDLTNPPASSRTDSFKRNDQQSVPAERHHVVPLIQARRARAVIDSHPPTCPHCAGWPTSRTSNLRTPPTAYRAVALNRNPQFVPT